MFSGFDFGGSSISQGGRGISQVLYKTKFLHFSLCISLLDFCRQYSVSKLVSDSRKPKRKSHIHQLQTDYNEWRVLTMSKYCPVLTWQPSQIKSAPFLVTQFSCHRLGGQERLIWSSSIIRLLSCFLKKWSKKRATDLTSVSSLI